MSDEPTPTEASLDGGELEIDLGLLVAALGGGPGGHHAPPATPSAELEDDWRRDGAA